MLAHNVWICTIVLILFMVNLAILAGKVKRLATKWPIFLLCSIILTAQVRGPLPFAWPDPTGFVSCPAQSALRGHIARWFWATHAPAALVCSAWRCLPRAGGWQTSGATYANARFFAYPHGQRHASARLAGWQHLSVGNPRPLKATKTMAGI